MKKILFAIVAVFFIACDGDKLVKFEYEKGNKELFEKANNLIKEKYPDSNFYSWKSLENISSIDNAKQIYNKIENYVYGSKQEYFKNDETHYSNYILLEKNGRYRILVVECSKASKYKNPFGLVINNPERCNINEMLIRQK